MLLFGAALIYKLSNIKKINHIEYLAFDFTGLFVGKDQHEACATTTELNSGVLRGFIAQHPMERNIRTMYRLAPFDSAEQI